ncbi:hypothetical protein [Bradyrhizobium sp. URHC0002]
MQLIEAALAFAITMLALSLVVSSFVEIIHRIFSMREAGLKYVLGQMFDQVLHKHIRSGIAALVQADASIAAADKNQKITELVEHARKGFAERMAANRAPMGVTPKATPTNPAPPASSNPEPASWLSSKIRLGLSKIRSRLPEIRLWNGRDLAAMTSAEFMERLGSMEHVGQAIAKANIDAKKAAEDAGATAADAAHVVLKDVAQKFEAFGKEASVYFEGRARLLSVVVAMALAFLAHVDAVDLFKTYLRDPNARAKVIEQSEAITAQHKAAAEAAKTLKDIDPNGILTPEEVKKQIETLKNDWKEAVTKANATVKQYADLGLPLGWTDERIDRARTSKWVWTCKDPNKIEGEGLESLWKDCGKNQWRREIWVQVPTSPAVWFYLFLGGLLVGLGAPFWYKAVIGLTNLRNGARGTASADAQTRAAFVAVGVGTTQPVTPVDAFRVSHAAQPPR